MTWNNLKWLAITLTDLKGLKTSQITLNDIEDLNE